MAAVNNKTQRDERRTYFIIYTLRVLPLGRHILKVTITVLWVKSFVKLTLPPARRKAIEDEDLSLGEPAQPIR